MGGLGKLEGRLVVQISGLVIASFRKGTQPPFYLKSLMSGNWFKGIGSRELVEGP